MLTTRLLSISKRLLMIFLLISCTMTLSCGTYRWFSHHSMFRCRIPKFYVKTLKLFENNVWERARKKCCSECGILKFIMSENDMEEPQKWMLLSYIPSVSAKSWSFIHNRSSLTSLYSLFHFAPQSRLRINTIPIVCWVHHTFLKCEDQVC